MKNLATTGLCRTNTSPFNTHPHTRTRIQLKHSSVFLLSLISTETQREWSVTYPLQPREMLVNINVPIHAGHPCQQLDSLVEKALFLAGNQVLSPSLPLPSPLRNAKLCSNFPTSLACVLQPFPKQFQIYNYSDQTKLRQYPPHRPQRHTHHTQWWPQAPTPGI